MMEEYCHFILSRDKNDILYPGFPKKYRKKIDILNDFDYTMDYSSNRWRWFNATLSESLNYLFYESNLLNRHKMLEDALKIYRRCEERVPSVRYTQGDSGYIIDYLTVFEILSDFIWLYLSQQKLKKGFRGTESLIENFNTMHIKYNGLFNELLNLSSDSKHCYSAAKKALELKNKLFPGLISDDLVRYYYSEFSYRDLEQEVSEIKKEVECSNYLYFAMISTSVRYEEIRRG